MARCLSHEIISHCQVQIHRLIRITKIAILKRVGRAPSQIENFQIFFHAILIDF